MPQFIVHFGAHKTGTTAFQSWLRRNRTRLFDCGIIVPRLGASSPGNFKPLVRAMAGLPGRTPTHAKDMLLSLSGEMKAAPDHDIIISAEYLWAGEFREHLPSFTDKLDSYGYRKKAIMIVRDQASWMNSRHAHRRKMLMGVPRSFESFVQNHIAQRRGSWTMCSETLVGLGFEFSTLPYARDFKTAGAVKKIMSLPGLEGRVTIGDDETAIRQNSSLGAIGLIVSDQVRDRALEQLPVLDKRVRRRLSMLIKDRVDRRVKDTPFNALTPELSLMIANAYNDENKDFARQYFDQPWSDFFPPDDMPSELSPRRIEDLDHRDAATVTRIADNVIKRANELNLLG